MRRSTPEPVEGIIAEALRLLLSFRLITHDFYRLALRGRFIVRGALCGRRVTFRFVWMLGAFVARQWTVFYFYVEY
jgi:hypothetical protein